MALELLERPEPSGLQNETARKWLSFATMIAAAVVLVVVLVWIGTAAAHPAAATCSNPPARVVSLPQWFEVLLCLMGFGLGRVTARARIEALEPGAQVQVAVWLQAALTGALFLIALLLAFETVTLAEHVWPLTYYMRCANEAATGRALAAAFAICFLAGRWLWLPRPPDEVR